jgi:hypothetical protein
LRDVREAIGLADAARCGRAPLDQRDRRKFRFASEQSANNSNGSSASGRGAVGGRANSERSKRAAKPISHSQRNDGYDADSRQSEVWPEFEQRTVQWVEPSKAASLIREPDLKKLVATFVKRVAAAANKSSP